MNFESQPGMMISNRVFFMNYRTLRPVVACFLLLATSGDSLAAEGPLLQAGAAAVDISPRALPAIMNGGFLQKHTDRVIDPLHARAIVISDGKETVAIVIVDSCMLPTTVCDEIKQLATQQTGISPDRILISATHTHTAPSVMEMCLGTGADEAYLQFLPARVARSISEAHKNLQSAKVGWTIVDGADLTNCRRWITRSDRLGTDPFGVQNVRAMMHPGYQNPNYVSPAGPIDPWLSVLSVVSAKDNSPICVMANLSMHYFGGGGFSADYFGEVARLLEARIGKTGTNASPGLVGMMSQGTSGDLHWMDYSRPRSQIRRQQYSERVADRILQAWKTIQHRSDLSLAMAEERLTIDRRTPSRDRRRWARPINAGRGDLPPRNRTEVYAQQVEWIHENPKAEVVLQAVRIGDLGITAIPNEVYGITGLKLKRQSPLAATFNLELANGAVGYIPPPEQHRLGGYTTWPARTAGLAEEAEPLIVETLLKLLETVADKKRLPFVNPNSAYSEAVESRKPVAYWRLDDIVSSHAEDAAGNHDASFHGGVALFLPESNQSRSPASPFGSAEAYGNRCVYLAGGHLAADLKDLGRLYSVTMWFQNALPSDAREVTGVLLSNESETLLIAGKAEGEDAGKLVLNVGSKSWKGESRVVTKHWQQVTLTREKGRVRVYLDGNEKPDIDADVSESGSSKRWWIGSDGKITTTFDGKVDEVAVFNRVLVASDIAELYQKSGMQPPPVPKPTIALGPKPFDAEARQQYADAVLVSKPVAFWRLHDKSKQTVTDSVGDHVAEYESGSAPLKSGTAQPNFTGGRVNARVPNLGNTYSVEFWFRNEMSINSRPVTAYLFSRAVDGVDGADGDNLGIGGTHSHNGRLIVFNGNGRNELVAGQTRIARGSWSHVVMVREDQTMTVYLNGDPNPEIAAELPIAYPDQCDDILLGGRADNFANLQGMLEEVACYDRALDAQEVVAHFKAAHVAQLKKATRQLSKPTPTEAAKALETIHVREGYKVELVAAEPLVKDPVAIDWGPDGKLWVVEMADYPLGIDGKGKPGGRVRFLEDTDNDGQYDRSTLFADGLSFPTGILVWGHGILVTAAPQIVYLEDRSGDGKADVRRDLYSGFLEGNQQLRVNGLRQGLDNWVYCASGSHHGGYGKDSQITSHVANAFAIGAHKGSGLHLQGPESLGNSDLSLDTTHQIGSRDFRIRPDTGEIDPQSGPSQYGRNRDDWGNWFGVQNSHPLWHYVLADHHIRRNPHFAPPDPRQQVVTPSNPPVYPASKLQKRYHSFSQSGRFTSACSAMLYRDNYLFQRGGEQHAFTCEPFHNLVQHNLIADDGVSFKFRRDPTESQVDFFASEDRWCRPVMARTGPDGALWIVDMYRYMIEHPQWLPQNGKDELRPWYRSGVDQGRIYRVVRSDRPARNNLRLDNLATRQLVAMLESPSGWQRDTAQRMLVRRSQRAATEPLKALATKSGEPLARLHALWTLQGLGALSKETLQAALEDSHRGIRRNALRIAARNKVDVSRLVLLANDPDAKVRLELATTLGHYESPQASAAIAKLAIDNSQDRYLVAAAMSSLNAGNVLEVLDFAIAHSDSASAMITLEIIGQAIAIGDRNTIVHVIKSVSKIQNNLEKQQRFDFFACMLDALAKRKLPVSKLPDSACENIAHVIQQARIAAADDKETAGIRSAAIRSLGKEKDHLESDIQLLIGLLVPQSPDAVQRAVVANLTRRHEPSVAENLLAGWRSHSPEIRIQILDAMTSRKPWAEVLRQHLEAGAIRASELSAPIQRQLLKIDNMTIQWQKVLAIKTSSDRREVLDRFRSALELSGDSVRGAAIFRKSCINCHQLKDEGHEVGPQLASITNKTKEALFTSILDPDAAVDAKYFNYTVLTTDGRVVSGKLETETGSSITLLSAGGKRESILRRDIEQLQASNKSVMPAGIERELNTQDLADLIQFVRDTFR